MSEFKIKSIINGGFSTTHYLYLENWNSDTTKMAWNDDNTLLSSILKITVNKVTSENKFYKYKYGVSAIFWF